MAAIQTNQNVIPFPTVQSTEKAGNRKARLNVKKIAVFAGGLLFLLFGFLSMIIDSPSLISEEDAISRALNELNINEELASYDDHFSYEAYKTLTASGRNAYMVTVNYTDDGSHETGFVLVSQGDSSDNPTRADKHVSPEDFPMNNWE